MSWLSATLSNLFSSQPIRPGMQDHLEQQRLLLERYEQEQEDRRLAQHIAAGGDFDTFQFTSYTAKKALKEDKLKGANQEKVNALYKILDTPSANKAKLESVTTKTVNSNIEVSFIFDDAEKFPPPFDRKYEDEFGTLTVYIPKQLVPSAALHSKKAVEQWFEIPLGDAQFKQLDKKPGR